MKRTTCWSSKAASGREGKGIEVTLNVSSLVPEWLISLLNQSAADLLEFPASRGFKERKYPVRGKCRVDFSGQRAASA